MKNRVGPIVPRPIIRDTLIFLNISLDRFHKRTCPVFKITYRRVEEPRELRGIFEILEFISV